MKIHDRVAAIISTEEVQQMGDQMTAARTRAIQVISEEFLNQIQHPEADFDPIGYILSESICDWGLDVSIIWNGGRV